MLFSLLSMFFDDSFSEVLESVSDTAWYPKTKNRLATESSNNVAEKHPYCSLPSLT